MALFFPILARLILSPEEVEDNFKTILINTSINESKILNRDCYMERNVDELVLILKKCHKKFNPNSEINFCVIIGKFGIAVAHEDNLERV